MAQPLTTEYLDKVLDKKLKEQSEHLFQKIKDHYDPKFSLIVERCDLLEAKINDLEQKMNFRFSIVESELENLKNDLKAYSKRDKEDSDAFNKDMVKLQRRVANLESQVKKLKSAQKQTTKA
ncbi:MAG TPA: hypothetical protein VHQ20_00035 [Patescibacteria group bacterium]|jgi:hypothetical protein|nr:hypothetical protein [Patescibacteria group bacterium]